MCDDGVSERFLTCHSLIGIYVGADVGRVERLLSEQPEGLLHGIISPETVIDAVAIKGEEPTDARLLSEQGRAPPGGFEARLGSS